MTAKTLHFWGSKPSFARMSTRIADQQNIKVRDREDAIASTRDTRAPQHYSN